MPGIIQHRVCEHILDCDGEAVEDYKGQCGQCMGNCSPVYNIADGVWEWGDCECSGTCGDGHDCKDYVDLTINLASFVIQYEAYCHCDPVIATSCDPFTGHAVGGAMSAVKGVRAECVVPATTFHIRMARAQCSNGCFWGGWHESSCDCNTCCTDSGDGEVPCDNGCDTFNNGAGCHPCDPDDPCFATDNGWASSLDEWDGVSGSEHGQSTGSALCTMGNLALAGCGNYLTLDPDPCDPDHSWTATGDQTCPNCPACYPDEWYQENPADNEGMTPGGNAWACASCGPFTPFHMEAKLEHGNFGCEGTWRLTIQGMTSMIRDQSGVSNHGCNCGATVQYALFRDTWSLTTGGGNCGGEGVEGLGFTGCSCPPIAEFESTVNAANMKQLHPTFIMDDGCNTNNKVCRAIDDYCGETCAGAEYDGDCYNSVVPWCGECEDGYLPVMTPYVWDNALSSDSPHCVDITVGMTPNNNPRPWWG